MRNRSKNKRRIPKLNLPKKSSLDFNRQRKNFRFERFSGVWTWVIQIVGVILLAYLLVLGFFNRQDVVGDSMNPSLEEGNTVFLDRASYVALSPRVGDVVAFKTTNNPDAYLSFKRVIAIPGDHVLIKDGYVYVNDNLIEDYNNEFISDAGVASNEILVEDGEYFVLGDNRNQSEDSRFASIGNIKKKDIIGKAWFCVSKSNFGPVIK